MVDQNAPPNEEDIQPAIRPHRRLSNRVAYLGLLSLLGPFVNFAYNWQEVKSMGITLSLMLWILFGGLWCFGFATVMGPIFAAFSVILRLLDVIPALGTSIWICVSTFVMVAVINDPFPAFMHNLPLFSLIFANGMMFLSELSQDQGFWDLVPTFSPSAIQANTVTASHYTGFKEPGYYWKDGQCCCGSYDRSSPPAPFFVFESLSVPAEASQSLEDLREDGYDYISGRELESYAEKFHTWEGHTKRVSSILNRRRAFCIIGFLLEAAAVVCTVAILGSLSGSGSSSIHAGNVAETESNPAPSAEAVNSATDVSIRMALIMSPREFSVPQIVICMVLIFFSDYLQTMINVHLSFTTITEVRATMVMCLSSPFFDWSGPRSGYLMNGRRIRGPKQLFEDDALPVKELPTLGIVADNEESERANNVILRSTVPSKLLSLNRIDDFLVSTTLYDPESDREMLLSSGNEKVELGDRDMVI